MGYPSLPSLFGWLGRSQQLLQFARGVIETGTTAAGVPVSESSALRSAPVYACVRVIAEAIMSLPLKLYRIDQSGAKRPDIEHPLYTILHDLPNPSLTSAEFREMLMGHVLLWGNGYAQIERDGNGQVRQLWPLRPDRMIEITRDQAGQLRYVYQSLGGERLVFRGPTSTRPSEIFHLRGLGYDGLKGYSPIGLLREAVALQLASQEFGARFFANQGQPLGALVVPRGLKPEAIRHLRESWRELHTGLSRAHRVAILEEGITWQQIGIPPEHAQFLETRQFQTEEIARIFRVPPSMLGLLDRVTYANAEQLFIQFVQAALLPWVVRWEQAIKRDLFTTQMWRTHEVRFSMQGLLRGDLKSRYEAYAVGRQWGWLSADDIRELEEMNPLPNGAGRAYLTPLNMAPAPAEPARRWVADANPEDLWGGRHGIQ